MSVPTPDEREKLHMIENDWREAIEAIKAAQEEHAKERRRQLAQVHADYRRLGRRLIAMCAALLVVVVAGLVVLSRQQSQIRSNQRQVEDSRRLATEGACEDRNRLAGGILFFVAEVAPDLTAQARPVFRMQPSCPAYARAVLAAEEPPPTVAGHSIPPVP